MLLSMFIAPAFAQKISKINLTQAGGTESIYFLLDDNITVSVSKEGNIIAWGVEVFSDRLTGYSRLDVYPGRTEKYTANDNEAFRDKLKYIGRTAITYYSSFDNEAYVGKVKTIGSTNFEYYSNFDDEQVKGRIKSAGPVTFTWYTSFDNEAFRGKLKSVGSTSIAYYASFDDKAFKGKIKSIDRATFTYYSSTEKREYGGMIKSGTMSQTINGIVYFVKP